MRNLLNRITILVVSLVLLASIASANPAQPQNALYQVSTINALLQGVYDGEVNIKELKEHGSFGIGTLERLDGELVVLDGKFYQVKSTGEVVEVKNTVKTPFATVMDFHADITADLPNTTNFAELESALDKVIPDKNYIYAIRIDGSFTGKTRSIPGKTRPYPTLSEAAKTQSVFNIENTPGTIVGFWCPNYVNGINVTGYHLHFVSADRKSGGHILNGGIASGKVQIARISDFRMVLPSGSAFKEAALNKDYSEELNGVEKSK